MSETINFISGLINDFVGYFSSLSEDEIILMLVLVAITLLVLTYRLFGMGAALGLLVLYFVFYVLTSNNLSSFVDKNKNENAQHMQTIESELELQ